MKRLPEIAVYGTLFLFVLLCYAQLAFFSGAVKYDMIDCTYAWRYFLSESMLQGSSGLWNPYQVMGYPFFADLQSGFWYPWFRLHALIRPYDIYSLHIDYILHAFLGVAGFYALLKRELSRLPAAAAACAYIASGFYLGHSQHFYFLITAAWLPWVILAWLNLWENGNWKKSAALAGALYMLFTGGYMALHIIFGWILLVFLVMALYRTRISQGWKALWERLRWQLLAATLFLISMSAWIYSLAYIWPEMSRTDALSLEDAQFNALTPRSLLSLLFPFGTTGDMELMGTDYSTSNIYMGWLGLLLPFFAWPQIRGNLFRVGLLIAGIFCLLAAMGPATPVHAFTYHFLPFGGVFRLPSIYRLFFVFAWLWLGAITLEQWRQEGKLRTWLLAVLALLALGIGSWLVIEHWAGVWHWIRQDLFRFPQAVNLNQQLGINALLNGVVWSLGLLLCWKFRKYQWKLLLLTALTDLLLNAQLVAPVTVYSHLYSPAYIDSVEQHFVKGWPVPENQQLQQNDDHQMGLHPFFRNGAQYKKRPGRGGFTSFFTRDFLALDADAERWEAVGQWPLASVWDSLECDPGSEACMPVRQDTANIRFSRFDPDKITLHISTTHPNTWLVLTQQQLKGVSYQVNGREVIPEQVAYCLPAIPLKGSGQFEVERTYNLPGFDTIIWGSIVGCLLILTLLLWPGKF